MWRLFNYLFGWDYVNIHNNYDSRVCRIWWRHRHQMKVTVRARAALNELLESGYAVPNEPTDSIPNREHYRGVDQEAHLGELLKETGTNPFGDELRWVMFEKI